MVPGERIEREGCPGRCYPESALPQLPLKSRGTKLYVEGEGKVAEHSAQSTNSTALGVIRGPGGFEFQFHQLAVSPRMSCYPSLSSFQKSFRIQSVQRRPSQEPL